MTPRPLAIGIAASLGFHAILAGALVLLPAAADAPAGDPTIVPLRLMESRSRAAAGGVVTETPAGAPALETSPVAPRERPRPQAPRAMQAPPGAPPAGPAGEERTPPPGAPMAATSRTDGVALAGDGDDGNEPGPAETPLAGAGGAEGTGAGPAGMRPDARPDTDALAQQRRAYALDVRRSLESVGRYPSVARRLGLAGEVLLRVRIDASGRVMQSAVDAPSSHPELDDAALASARRLNDLDPPPGGPIDVIVPVLFTMRTR